MVAPTRPETAGELYIGIMSGTSIDAVDAVLVDFSGNGFRVLGAKQQSITEKLRRDIDRLCHPGEDSIDLLGQTDRAMAMLFSRACNELLVQLNLDAGRITAIGSHGQTVRHRPGDCASPNHFTLQIGDPSTIAALTGITTVADFRRKDMARGGQGAPLVPGFHQFLFHSPDANRVVVNIGGIANISWLPAKGPVTGFDTGPGNRLLDIWANRHLRQPFDKDGAWARTGKPLAELLARLLDHPFLAAIPPKSTGREDFNEAWLLDQLHGKNATADIQATLSNYTARTIVDAFQYLPDTVDEIFICGGGAGNSQLLEQIRHLCPDTPVRTTADLGLPPQLVECAAFAWLARQTLNRRPGALGSVTGALCDSVLGGVFYP